MTRKNVFCQYDMYNQFLAKILMEYKDEDNPLNKETKIEGEESFSEEEMQIETILMPIDLIIQLLNDSLDIDRDPNEVYQGLAPFLENLQQVIIDSPPDYLEALANSDVPQLLMRVFYITPFTHILSLVAEILNACITKYSNPLLFDFDFTSVMFILATSISNDDRGNVNICSQIPTDLTQRRPILNLFRSLVRLNPEFIRMFGYSNFIARCLPCLNSNSFKHKKIILDLIRSSLTLQYSHPLTLEECGIIFEVLHKLNDKDVIYLDEFSKLLEIASTFFIYNDEFSEAFLQEINLMGIFNNVAGADYNEKNIFLNFIKNCQCKEGISINYGFSQCWDWSVISRFIEHEDTTNLEDFDNIVEQTLIWLIPFAKEYPQLLTGPEFEDFITNLLILLADSIIICRVQALHFLSVCIVKCNSKVIDYLCENSYFKYCAEFLDDTSENPEVIIDILYSIKSFMQRVAATNIKAFPELIDALSTDEVMDAIDDITLADDEELAAVATSIMDFVHSIIDNQ